jgi:hypothetical protein
MYLRQIMEGIMARGRHYRAVPGDMADCGVGIKRWCSDRAPSFGPLLVPFFYAEDQRPDVHPGRAAHLETACFGQNFSSTTTSTHCGGFADKAETTS